VGEWMDVGHLDYTATAVPPAGSNPAPCPLSSHSGVDPSLAPTPQTPPNTIPSSADSYLEDLQGDQPSNPAITRALHEHHSDDELRLYRVHGTSQ